MGNPAGPRKAYCTSCGELVDAGDRFCAYCGAELTHRERRERSQRREPHPHDRHRRERQSQPRQPQPRKPQNRQSHDRQPQGWQSRERQPQNRQSHERHSQKRQSSARYPREGYPPERHRRRRRRRTGDSPLRAVGVAIGLAVGGMLLLTLVAVVGTFAMVLLQIPVLIALGIAVTVAHFLGFVGLAWVYLQNRGYDSEQLRSYIGLHTPTVRQLGLVVVGNLVIVALLAVLLGLVEVFSLLPAEEGTESVQDELADLGVGVYLVLVAFMLAVVGPTEEVLYRGVIQNRLREQFSVVPGIAIASALFTAIHVQIFLVGTGVLGVVIGFLALFIPSLVLGGVYEYTENIVIPSLIHGIHNSLIITVLFFGPSFLADYVTF